MLARTETSFASRTIGEIDVYLVDTDVISEIRKGEKANPGVRGFFATASREAIPLLYHWKNCWQQRRMHRAKAQRPTLSRALLGQ